MKKTVLIVSVVSLALLGASCSGTSTTSTNPSANPTGTSSNTTNTTPTSTNGEVAGDEVGKDGEFAIRLTSPLADQVLKSPFLVAGEALVPGNVVYVQVKNPLGNVLISEQATVKANLNELGPFSVYINFQFQSTDRGIVEVFGRVQDGMVGLQSVPVKFDVESQSSVEAQ